VARAVTSPPWRLERFHLGVISTFFRRIMPDLDQVNRIVYLSANRFHFI
jgi:hypothetical protein